MEDESAISVGVRVRPLNSRERNDGHRNCVQFDDETRQVVLTAVDKNTLLQLRGAAAKGYAFDKRYGQESISDNIYDDMVSAMVEKVFQGYNATCMAYGQTGSGKTHTMSGGVGIHGKMEEGVTPRVIRHVFAMVEVLQKKAKPGEKVSVSACALELYNEDLLDLAVRSGRDGDAAKGWDAAKAFGAGLKLQERPIGRDGRVVPEVLGITEVPCTSAGDLKKFYDDCMENRSTSQTKMNDRSSRSHALFTITISRTMVDVLNETGDDMKIKVRTSEFESKLHLVDLAGSERVKRSGVSGKELKEATHINSGLLALGNVIVALAGEEGSKKKGHVPYRDSKLTRLLQDSLGGNSLTVLISCISPSEADFEETNNTLKYANRACHIKNMPLPNKFNCLEEDLLPSLPEGAAGMGSMINLTSLLEDHEKLKEHREKRAKDKADKEAKRQAELVAMRDEAIKKPGFQRLRSSQYDVLRRQLAGKGANISANQVVGDDTLVGFGRKDREDGGGSPGELSMSRSARLARAGPSAASKASRARSVGKASKAAAAAAGPAAGSSFAEWLAAQEAAPGGSVGTDDDGEDFFDGDEEGEDYEGDGGFIEEGEEGTEAGETGTAPGSDDMSFLDEDEAAAAATVSTTAVAGKSRFRGADVGKSKFVRGGGDAGVGDDEALFDDGEEEDEDEEEVFDPIQDDVAPKLLARFRVNRNDVLSVFKALSKEDFQDVVGLLPQGTPLPASDKMTYLLARLETGSGTSNVNAALERVAAGEATMTEAVGPAVGCLMATFGTNMISSCIFEFKDPEDLKFYGVEERIELWGLQIPHNSVRPTLSVEDAAEGGEAAGKDSKKGETITWTSVDRLNMSIGLLYALCNHATDQRIMCGFCVPRPQLLKRWLQAGVRMKQITGDLKLIYPTTAHDYEYYRASTVAYFMIDEVKEALAQVLAIVE